MLSGLSESASNLYLSYHHNYMDGRTILSCTGTMLKGLQITYLECMSFSPSEIHDHIAPVLSHIIPYCWPTYYVPEHPSSTGTQMRTPKVGNLKNNVGLDLPASLYSYCMR